MLDPLAPLRVVSTADPALDLDTMGDSLAEYARTRDPALLKFKLGAQPTWFVVRGMTVSYLFDVVYSARNGRTQSALAFMAAVHEVELPDGRRIAPDKISSGAYKQKIAGDSWLDQLRDECGLDAIEEIGLAAIERARLPVRARAPFASSGG